MLPRGYRLEGTLPSRSISERMAIAATFSRFLASSEAISATVIVHVGF